MNFNENELLDMENICLIKNVQLTIIFSCILPNVKRRLK